MAWEQCGDGKGAKWLTDAGFTDAQVRNLPHDILNSYYIVRKGVDATASVACLK